MLQSPNALDRPIAGEEEALSLVATAAYLAISETDLMRLARQGEIPYSGPDTAPRFRTVDLDKYLERKSIMTTWEYLFVEVMEEKRIPRAWTINGEEIRDWRKGPSIYAFTDGLGREGWELVSAPSNQRGALVGLVFKRQRLPSADQTF